MASVGAIVARNAVPLLAIVLTMPVASVSAQSPDVGRARPAAGHMPALWIGAGVTGGNGSNSERLGTSAGASVMAALEMPLRRALGPALLALRAEGRWSQQSLDTQGSSGLSGDVQTIGGGLTLRVSPFAARASASRRVTPYVLAGVGISRPSTRVSLFIENPDMPSARFDQTSSEIAATGQGGVGALFRVGRAQLFAEARTAFARRDAGTLRSTFGTLGLALRPRR